MIDVGNSLDTSEFSEGSQCLLHTGSKDTQEMMIKYGLCGDDIIISPMGIITLWVEDL